MALVLERRSNAQALTIWGGAQGPAGTTVALVLERGGKLLEATVERDEAEQRVWKVCPLSRC